MLDGFPIRGRILFQRRRAEKEIDTKLRFHTDKLRAKHIKGGMSPAEAARLTRVRIGGLARL